MDKDVLIDNGGRVAIGKVFREALNIKRGDTLNMSSFGDCIVISHNKHKPKTLTFEYMYNKVSDLEKELMLTNQRLEEIRTMVINNITKG